MPFVHADLVLETTTTTGTGTLTLAGAVADYLTFSSQVGVGNTCSYTLEASNGQKETGVGTVGTGTLERTTLVSSSTGAKLDLPAGTHYIGVTTNSRSFLSSSLPAGQLYVGDASGQAAAVTISGGVTISDTGVATVSENSFNFTDVTTANANTTRHGLLPKAVAPASTSLLTVLGIANGNTAWSGKQLFDSVAPADLGTATTGTSLIAARRDHVHTLPAIDALGAATDITTLDSSTTAHGLLIKATAPASGFLNVVGIGNGETVYANKALFDDINPAALGTAAPGTSLIAARRDHVHDAPPGSAADIDQYDIAARLVSGTGAYTGVAAVDLTEEGTPAAGMFVPGWLSTGELRKFNVGNLSGGSVDSYAMTFSVANISSVASATTYYFGNSQLIPGNAPGRYKIYIPKSGTLKVVDIFSYAATAGSGEAWEMFVRLNNTTNTSVATVSAATNERRWVNTSLSVAVVIGDWIEFTCITPTFSSAPNNLRLSGVVMIES